MKKEWFCLDVQAAYRDAGCGPREIPKNQYGLGLLSCNSDCKNKVQVVDSELHLRKSKDMEVKSFNPTRVLKVPAASLILVGISNFRVILNIEKQSLCLVFLCVTRLDCVLTQPESTRSSSLVESVATINTSQIAHLLVFHLPDIGTFGFFSLFTRLSLTTSSYFS